MQLSREPLRDRLARRMDENKAAKLEAAKKNPPPPPPDHDKLDRQMCRGELTALEGHLAKVESQIRHLAEQAPTSFENQEAVAEAGALRALRRELQADHQNPITSWPDGKPLTDRDRAFRRFRASEIKANKLAAAERAQSEGDFRRARQLRVDALRSRRIVEYEMKIRASLSGYSA